ncbi:hypothetical protein HYY75_11500, partial [bacterium]|nr:hypothetical protein [bacterium]
MIRDSIKINDKYEFEIKVGYDLHEKNQKISYDIDAYFFIPTSWGINKETYSKADFYDDMQVCLRFETPSFLLDDFAHSDHEIYGFLSTAMETMIKSRTIENIQKYENQLKMFCCIFRAALSDYVSFIDTRKNLQDEEIAIPKFFKGVKAVAQNFRAMRKIITIPTFDEKLFSLYLFADEYISLLIEKYSFEIIQSLETHQMKKRTLLEPLEELVRSENSYRVENKYPSVIRADESNEVFLYRGSVLKKYMRSILNLNVERQMEDKIIEHFLFAIAAGISMVVATAIAFYSQIQLGNLTFSLFVALVISYMMKDRIKELAKQFFASQLRKYLYDHKEKILYSPTQVIGVCTETVDFCNTKSVPDKIHKIRNGDHFSEIESGWVGQHIIRYKRSIELFSQKITETFHNYRVKTVNDIIKFNVSKFLAKMDDPQRILFYLAEGGVKSFSSERA